MSQMGQVTQDMANMHLINNAGGHPELRNQKNVYNSKFTQGNKTGGHQDVKSTPQHMISSKIGTKGMRAEQTLNFNSGQSN